MSQFSAKNKDVEVNGAAIESVVSGMKFIKGVAIKILEDHNIVEPASGRWYLQQDWLDAFKEISEKVGDKTLYSIGLRMPESVFLPENIDSLEKMLSSIDVIYHWNHRLNGKLMYDQESGDLVEGIGHYNFKKIGEAEGEIVCDNPYPCEFDRGLLDACVRLFRYSGGNARVKHVDSNACRKFGGERCVYTIKW